MLPLFLVGLLAWPFGALIYLANEPHPTVGRLVFPFPWAARPAWQMLAA